ncbi:PAS domain-containing protein [Laspinema sp. A4]|uniref:PAS domain-containing protein n=1 Tax=Laspinema sp. D2d TaxID=2953686 RepID=UPI0021BA6E36|nr:PAS domain-containing protein [Laspinema sp. D2d]MCT7985730.1 PAS domain-containing protein [Laspinema sp. D2d]
MTDEQFVRNFSDLRSEARQPVVIADDEGFVVYINPQFSEIYHWGSELIGQTLADIIPLNFHDSHNLGFSRFSMTEISHVANHPINAMVIDKHGDSVLSEHYITAEKIEGRWYFAAQLRPLNPSYSNPED